MIPATGGVCRLSLPGILFLFGGRCGTPETYSDLEDRRSPDDCVGSACMGCRLFGQECNESLGEQMTDVNIRRLVLDVDKAMARPQLPDLARAINAVPGVEALNIVVTEIDLQTVGMEITIQGEMLDYDAIVRAIEEAGAVAHSIDEIATGNYLIEPVKRSR